MKATIDDLIKDLKDCESDNPPSIGFHLHTGLRELIKSRPEMLNETKPMWHWLEMYKNTRNEK